VGYAISSSALLAVTHLFLDACSGGLLLLLLLSMIIVALDYCRIIANSKGIIIRVLLPLCVLLCRYYVVIIVSNVKLSVEVERPSDACCARSRITE